jgi:hypothetical protein
MADSSRRAKHGDDCGCTRCRGFQPGHTASLKHGAYSVVAIRGRVAEIADRIRIDMPVRSPADEMAIEGLAIVTARIEKAYEAIAQLDEAVVNPIGSYLGDRAEAVTRMRDDLRRWLALQLRYEEALGLTARSRAGLGLDIALGVRAMGTAITPDRLREALESGEIEVEEAEVFAKVWRVLLETPAHETVERALHPAETSLQPPPTGGGTA